MITLFSLFYTLAWLLALPVLRIVPRISRGWQERTMQKAPAGPFDIWLQAASGGEAQMAVMLLDQLSLVTPGRQLKILVTAGTPEGVATLSKAQSPGLDIQVSYFPFDAFFLMNKAFKHFSPKMAVIIETELWPGFLITARKSGVPVLVVNGRMTGKSFRSYRLVSNFFSKYGPERVLAISAADRHRFASLVGNEKTGLMNNIKFDRISPLKTAPPLDRKLQKMVAGTRPFIILGSIRKQEEKEILKTIIHIISCEPETLIGIFPKHLSRANSWMKILKKHGIPAVKRQETEGIVSPGVVVWDSYGELAAAYALADAAFVGGSLADLGGQNFLEPLICGLRPCIGPYWKNFSWVGDGILSEGLVHQVHDAGELAEALLLSARTGENRNQVLEEAQRYFEPRKGGTAQACDAILNFLK